MGCLPLLVTHRSHDGLLHPGHLAPLEVLPVIHPGEVQRAVHHQLLDSHLRARGADHHLAHHLPVRTVDLEAEHVGRLVSFPESQVEVVDGIRLDERNRDLAYALDIETPAGEGGSAEPGGEGGIELAVAGLVKYRDGERHAPPGVQVASPSDFWAEGLVAGASGYSMRGPRKPMSASRI